MLWQHTLLPEARAAEVGAMDDIRADLWVYLLKLWGFFPKQTAKNIRLELLRLGSANQELSIFPQLANEPVFTPNISKPHLARWPVPGAGSQGDEQWAGRVAGAGSAEHPSFNTSQ